MEITIWKFGGASVNSAEGLRNVAMILGEKPGRSILTVISAMGKTTNALEAVLRHYMNNDPPAMIEAFGEVRDYHFRIVDELFTDHQHPVYGELISLFDQLRGYIRKGHLYSDSRPAFDFEYDQIVSYGELFSTLIMHHYLSLKGFRSVLLDARELIKTDGTCRDARVDWELTGSLIKKKIQDIADGTGPGPVPSGQFPDPGTEASDPSGVETAAAEHGASLQPAGPPILITQGFIGSDQHKNTTTLGREGSDFSAAIFAYCLGAREITIWKDVPGVMNADPKWIPGAVTLPLLSYREAIELAYYGASVIHPKTIKPLENAGIVLHVRSFRQPSMPGTIVKELDEWRISMPILIRKPEQVLISISPRDFSFIMEENLSDIFRVMAGLRVKANMMQNSAISFSVCVDNDPQKLPDLLTALQNRYMVRYNSGVELFTIRHYRSETVDQLTGGRTILLEQKTRNTVQIVVL